MLRSPAPAVKRARSYRSASATQEMMHKGASRSPTAAKGAVAYVMQILLHMILCGEMQAIVVRLAGADTCAALVHNF